MRHWRDLCANYHDDRFIVRISFQWNQHDDRAQFCKNYIFILSGKEPDKNIFLISVRAIQHTLAVHRAYVLEILANGNTAMREFKTLWEKWG
jgi:hypothetical protein